jgi:probable O-glycosylation ligase (exosortase A-associated)
MGGGVARVYGPPDSFLEENNGMGLALIVMVPLMRYLQLQATKKWQRLALGGAMLVTTFAILGSQSRGAFLGLIAMGAFLVLKSRNRWKAIWAVIVIAPLLFVFMPSSWHERIGTIETYDQDKSAMGRINAWWFAVHLAEDRPLVGGGFSTFSDRLFPIYAPNPTDVHDAHSIYFEVLGEQGFVGLAFFLGVGFAAVASCRRIRRLTENRPDLQWARDLGAMAQVSLVGFAVSGAFLGLAYFDLPWNLMLIIVLTRLLVEQAVTAPVAQASQVPKLAAPSRATGAAVRPIARAG